MATHFYKAVLKGMYAGQEVVNVLWYRDDGSGIFLGRPYFGGEDIAFQVRQEVWPALRGVLPSGYRLNAIEATVHNDSFDRLTGTPHILPVNDGGALMVETNGPATVAILAFTLRPVYGFGAFNKPPKRGYLAIGPLGDGTIDSTGHLLIEGMGAAAWDSLKQALISPLENANPLGQFFPVRISQRKLLGVINFGGYSDILDATLRGRASFRRSRVPEV